MTLWPLLVVLALASGCGYNARFGDCTVRCNSATECPSGFACGDEGLCRAAGTSQTCEEVLGDANLGDDGGGGGDGGAGAFVGDDLAYVKASNTGTIDQYGEAIALAADGSTFAVGAVGEDGNGTSQANDSNPQAGAVYVYVRSGATWAQQAYVKAPNIDTGDQFGRAVALSADGNTLAVGAPTEDSASTGIDQDATDNGATDSGAVYVYVRAGNQYTLQAYVKASNTGANDNFGRTITLSGDGNTLAVGAPFEDSGIPTDQTNNGTQDAGAAYVFTRTGTTWTQQSYLKADAPANTDTFGFSVALSADGARLAIGAPADTFATVTKSGTAYVFRRSGATWVREVLLPASTPGGADEFGASVALSADGSRLVVGAPAEDSSAKNIGGDETDNAALDSGAVYVFRREGTDWGGEAYVKASNTDSGDRFGAAVALATDGATLVIGASREDSNATRIGGDQENDQFIDAGAAYVLVRSGITWTHGAYVKSSNPEDDDEFGCAVGISGDATTAVFGARGEDSPATGVDGDQLGSGSPVAGAAYVYF